MCSVAAYKSVALARMLVRCGAHVKVMMSNDSKKFIHPNSFAAITGNPVYSELFDDDNKETMLHIRLSKWADILIICPASASTIGKLASAIYDNLLTTVCSATDAKMVFAPSMNKNMWENPIVQENVRKLEDYGYSCIYPVEGEQACGDFGYGRMQEPDKILEFLSYAPLKGYRVIVTAGPTVEPIDPIRYISNKSSGKMGYAIASTFHNLGADVSLITGPTQIAKPVVNKVINVITAKEMYNAVLKEVYKHDIFISVAAVADYRLATPSESKIKKGNFSLNLDLETTDDIMKNAKKKVEEKKLDFIVANKVEKTGYPFYSDENSIVILDKFGNISKFDKPNKQVIAYNLSELVVKYIEFQGRASKSVGLE